MRQRSPQSRRPWIVLPHTYQTRDFAPALAARLDRALVTDCTGIKADSGGPTFSRPMFQGKLAADVRPLGESPWLVTMQIGSFRADQAQKGAAAVPVRAVDPAIDASAIRQKPEPPFQEARQAVDLSQAQRIVAVGRGIKGPEHLPLAENLANALGAELAASRPICDAGWLPMERQIGSSGQTVAPKLYVAVGISGAIQHVVGMKGARTIVAINKDPEAPDLRDRRLWLCRRSVRVPAGADRGTEEVSERETLEVDVLIVGGGPAGMSAALASRAAAEGAVRRAADDRSH